MIALGPITTLLGVATVAAAAVSHSGTRSRGDNDDVLISWGLIWVWCFGVAARILTPAFFPEVRPPLYLYSGPIIDLLFGWFVLLLYVQRRPRPGWKTALLALVGLQAGAHLLFGLAPKSRDLVYAYKATLNVTYVGQLICAATPGARHLFRRRPTGLPAGRRESAG